MAFRLSEDGIPDGQPHCEREFLEWAIHERVLSPRTIAYELGVSKSRVTIYAERLGVVQPWRHEALRTLFVEQGLSATETAA